MTALPHASPARPYRHLPAHGRVEVICGGMFSGKSEELIRRLTRARIAGQSVLAAKPSIDDRYARSAIASHAGRRWECVTVSDSGALGAAADGQPGLQVLGVEEAQFFDRGLTEVVRRLAARGVRVICAGLDLDALGRPFGPVADLICEAESVTKLAAVCVCCGADACRSQLLVDGRPMGWTDGPVINVGGAETYEARCRSCFVVPGRSGS